MRGDRVECLAGHRGRSLDAEECQDARGEVGKGHDAVAMRRGRRDPPAGRGAGAGNHRHHQAVGAGRCPVGRHDDEGVPGEVEAAGHRAQSRIAQAGLDGHVRGIDAGIDPAHRQGGRRVPRRRHPKAVLVEGFPECAGNGSEVQARVVRRRPAPGTVAGTDGGHRGGRVGWRHRRPDRERRHGPALAEAAEHGGSRRRHVLPGHAGHDGEHHLPGPGRCRRCGSRRSEEGQEGWEDHQGPQEGPGEEQRGRRRCESCGEKATRAPPDLPHSLGSPPRRRPRICS